MLIKLEVATKLGAQQCFAHLGLRTGDIQIHGVMAILLFLQRMAEQGSHGFVRIGFAPISCRNYASASAMKGVLQSIINDVFIGTLV